MGLGTAEILFPLVGSEHTALLTSNKSLAAHSGYQSIIQLPLIVSEILQALILQYVMYWQIVVPMQSPIDFKGTLYGHSNLRTHYSLQD